MLSTRGVGVTCSSEFSVLYVVFLIESSQFYEVITITIPILQMKKPWPPEWFACLIEVNGKKENLSPLPQLVHWHEDQVLVFWVDKLVLDSGGNEHVIWLCHRKRGRYNVYWDAWIWIHSHCPRNETLLWLMDPEQLLSEAMGHSY